MSRIERTVHNCKFIGDRDLFTVGGGGGGRSLGQRKNGQEDKLAP